MSNRAYGFTALLAVIAVSIVFGMVLGGKLNAPSPVLAAPASTLTASDSAVELAPAVSGSPVASFADIAERALPSVVGVTNTQLGPEDEESEEQFRNEFFRWFFGEPENRERRRFHERPQQGFGSGFVVSREGYILTNHHVVAGSDRIVVRLHDGERYEAELIGGDPMIDLAVIKVDPGEVDLQALPLGDSEALRVGEWVIAIGNPLEYQHSVTVGVVSAKGRRVAVGETDATLAHFIQTDAAINFGNSGGPLLDAAGNVVGINTAIRRGDMAEGIGFALPINDVRRAMEQIVSSGKVRRGFLGISLNPQGLSQASADYYGLPDTNGVIVLEVEDDEPAEKAGIKKNDIIRKVDGEVVKDNLDLIKRISSRQPGDRVEIEVFRDGETIRKVAKLAERGSRRPGRQSVEEDREPAEPEQPREASALGLTIENISASTRRSMRLDDELEGVLVVDVDFTSEAADAGIVPDLIVSSINDRPTRNVADWNSITSELRPGRPVKLEVVDPRTGLPRYVFISVPEE